MNFSGHKTPTCVATFSYYCHACDDDAVNISLRPTTIPSLLQFFILFRLFSFVSLFPWRSFLYRTTSHVIIGAKSASLKNHLRISMGKIK